MNYTPVKTPKLVQQLLPNLIWSISSKDKCLYLTFDDGPTPEITSWVLKTLNVYNAKATFFCIGQNVEEHIELYRQIISEGHVVGNHTYSHLKGLKTSRKNYIADVNKAAQFINSNLFRPPYGRIKPKQAKAISELGFKIVMWNVLSIDWDSSVSLEKCLNNVIDNTKSGDIVVFHDSVKAFDNMKFALPKVLEYFSEKGYAFKCIPEPNQ